MTSDLRSYKQQQPPLIEQLSGAPVPNTQQVLHNRGACTDRMRRALTPQLVNRLNTVYRAWSRLLPAPSSVGVRGLSPLRSTLSSTVGRAQRNVLPRLMLDIAWMRELSVATRYELARSKCLAEAHCGGVEPAQRSTRNDGELLSVVWLGPVGDRL
jgi:hypothetical protein